MRVIRWTASGYENGRITGRYGRPYAIRDLVKHVDPTRWQERARSGQNERLAPWARDWSLRDFYQLGLLLHEQSLRSLPPVDRYPELRNRDQYLDDFARGIADETGVSFEEAVWTQQYRNVYNFVHTVNQPEPDLPGVPAGCTTVIFGKTPLGPIVGRNMDDGANWIGNFPRFGEATLNVVPPGEGYSVVEGQGGRFNQRGLCVYGSSISYPLEPESDERFPADLQEMLASHCATVDEAIELARRYARFGSSTNVAVVDANGDAAAIEKGKARVAIRRADGRGVVFATSGVAVEPETRQFMEVDGENYQWNLARFNRLGTLTADCPLTVEQMWRTMTDHHPTDFICKHFDKVAPGALGTLHQYVVLPAEERYFAREYDAPNNLPPCRVPPVEHTWSFAPVAYRPMDEVRTA